MMGSLPIGGGERHLDVVNETDNNYLALVVKQR